MQLRTFAPITILAVALLVAAGCDDPPSSEDTPAYDDAAASGPFDPEETVASFSRSTSFLDMGAKGMVFEDGTGYAHQMVVPRERKFKFVSFALSEEAQRELIGAFNHHRFHKLPKSLRINATDGSSVRIGAADSDTNHSVRNYMHDNADFRAIQDVFGTILKEKIEQEKAAEPKAYLLSLQQQVNALPKDSARRKLAQAWLLQTATLMLYEEVLPREDLRQLNIQGLTIPEDTAREEKPAVPVNGRAQQLPRPPKPADEAAK